MKRKFDSEADLARRVVAWLENQHWDVYQEVQPRRLSHTADIVAVQNRIVWVIECKTSFGLSVIAQAHRWSWLAHYVSVAVPAPTRNTGGEYAMAGLIVRGFGIGHLSISEYGDWASVDEQVKPRLARTASTDYILESLTPEHKTFAEAGNNKSQRWSPFQQTCRSVRQAVELRPGISMKDLIGTVETHYHSTSTARSCLKHWIEAGKVAGVRMERDGRFLRLYPV